MLTPCPRCDQQVIPDGEGACPLCGGTILEPGAGVEQPRPERPDENGDPESKGQTREAASDGDASAQPRGSDASPEGSPVWAQAADDLVAPEGLIGDEADDDDGDEVDAQEAPDQEDRAASRAPAAAFAATEGPLATSASKPGLLAPGLLLILVLAVQAATVFWEKTQDGAAGFTPVFGFAAILVLAIAALFLLGRGALRKVGLRPFTSFHFLLVLFAAPAVSVFAAQAGHLVSQMLPERLRPPVRDDISDLALAIAGLCVVPALAQELVIRGILGRSLIAKFGSLCGMLLTCLAFAACFVWPERIAEWFVIGVMVQLVYLATRSLGAAIMLNALCATVALMMQRYPEALNIPGYTYPQITPFVPWTLLLASGAVLTSILVSLYITRARFMTAAGTPWTPGYSSLEHPPSEARTQLLSPDAHGGLVVVVVTLFAGFLVTLFFEHQHGSEAVEKFKATKVLRPQPLSDGAAQPGMGMAMPKGMPAMGGLGMGKGMGGAGMGKGGGKKGKAAGKGPGGPGQAPLTEGSPEKKRSPRPEGSNDREVTKPAPDQKAPDGSSPESPKAAESLKEPSKVSAAARTSAPNTLEVDSLPPAREPAR